MENLSDKEAMNLHEWSRYVSGARAMLRTLLDCGIVSLSEERKNLKVYDKAINDLILSSLDNCWKFMQVGTYRIGYRNHKTDKKGRLVSCEAYFIDD